LNNETGIAAAEYEEPTLEIPKPDRLQVKPYETQIRAFDTLKNISVQLIGTDENPVSGQRLDVIAAGNGEVNSQPEKTTITTDENGTAYFDLTAGKKTGILRVRVRCQDPEFKHITADLETVIIPNEPSNLEIHNNLQAHPAGRKLPKPIRVVVQDRFGNPVNEVAVSFQVTMGDGFFDNNGKKMTETTNVNGEITMDFTLGKEPGFNAVDVRVADTDLVKAFQAVGQD